MDRGIDKRKEGVEQILERNRTDLTELVEHMKSEDFDDDNSHGGLRMVSSKEDSVLGEV